MSKLYSKKNDTKSKASSFVGIIFCVFWILLTTALFSDAGIIIFAHHAVIAFILGWLVTWAFRLNRYFRSSKKDQKIDFSLILYWGYEPLVLLTFLVLAYSGTLKQARFNLSYAAMNQYVKDVNDGKVDMNFEFYQPTRQIGLYSTTMTDQLPNKGVRFVTSVDGLFTNAGFAYFPETAPPVKDKNSYTRIDGSWWLWKRGF